MDPNIGLFELVLVQEVHAEKPYIRLLRLLLFVDGPLLEPCRNIAQSWNAGGLAGGKMEVRPAPVWTA